MFEIKSDGFYLNHEPFHIYSGAMHYFRILPQYWEDRLVKLKAAGFNAVETVMCWNMHEPKKGVYNYTGMFDIVRFIKTAQRAGLYVILRPGPYTCGEWDFGGFPAWLLQDKNMQIRCSYEPYLQHVTDYYRSFLPRLSELQVHNGGNILAMQIENEYGSYGNDKIYLKKIKELIESCGIDVPLFTSDGSLPYMLSGGTLPEVYKTLNFGSDIQGNFKALTQFQANMPKMCMEFWCGWFDHWGEKHHTRDYKSVLNAIEAFLDMDMSFNIYMFHGGTNFNFWAGANYGDKYEPMETSYDYCALLTEYGEITPAYTAVSALLHKRLKLPPQQETAPVALQNIGEVTLTKSAGVLENLNVLAQKHCTAHPESMEFFGQNFGWILYSTTIHGYYAGAPLKIEGVHDIAYLFIDGRLVKRYDRRSNPERSSDDGFSYPMSGFNGEVKIDILVEGMGRINYGEYMMDRKGISRVVLGQQVIFGWDVYTIPFEDFEGIKYSEIQPFFEKPMILKGTFTASSQADCFVDMKGFKKGFVVINGFNLGRYWEIGPQRTLYLPGVLLKDENEILVVEQEGYQAPSLCIVDKPVLDKRPKRKRLRFFS